MSRTLCPRFDTGQGQILGRVMAVLQRVRHPRDGKHGKGQRFTVPESMDTLTRVLPTLVSQGLESPCSAPTPVPSGSEQHYSPTCGQGPLLSPAGPVCTKRPPKWVQNKLSDQHLAQGTTTDLAMPKAFRHLWLLCSLFVHNRNRTTTAGFFCFW